MSWAFWGTGGTRPCTGGPGWFRGESAGAHGPDKDGLGGMLLQQMELIGADVLGAELIREDAKAFGELGDIAQIAVDGVGRVVANLHVFEYAST